jgi:hypothetical protein
MWWADGSSSDDGQVGAAAVCKDGNQGRFRRSYLFPGRREVFDTETWAITLTLDVVIKKRETLLKHGMKTVVVFSDSQAPIRRAAAGSRVVTGEVDQQKSTESPRPRHRN